MQLPGLLGFHFVPSQPTFFVDRREQLFSLGGSAEQSASLEELRFLVASLLEMTESMQAGRLRGLRSHAGAWERSAMDSASERSVARNDENLFHVETPEQPLSGKERTVWT